MDWEGSSKEETGGGDLAIDYSDAKTDRDLERMEDRPWKRTEVSSPRGDKGGSPNGQDKWTWREGQYGRRWGVELNAVSSSY